MKPFTKDGLPVDKIISKTKKAEKADNELREYFYGLNIRMQDCSYQGKALNVPTAHN